MASQRKQPRFLIQRSLGRRPWPGPPSGIFCSFVSQSSKSYNMKGEVLGIPEVAKLGRSVGELGTQELVSEVGTVLWNWDHTCEADPPSGVVSVRTELNCSISNWCLTQRIAQSRKIPSFITRSTRNEVFHVNGKEDIQKTETQKKVEN